MNSYKIEIPRYKTKFGLKNKISRALWNISNLLFFRYTPSFIKPFNIWRIFLLKLFGAKIGKYTIVYPSVKIWAPWNLEIGRNSCIGPNVNCYNPEKLIIGDKVTISQNSYICGGSHDINKLSLPFISSPIIIRNYVWICANSFIMMGVIIEEGAIIGANSAVYKNVQSYQVVGGNPAKYIKKREMKYE